MESNARETSDRATVPPTEQKQIGRVRLTEEGDYPDQATGSYPQEGSWSPQAIVLGIAALLVIIASLLLILWGSFQG